MRWDPALQGRHSARCLGDWLQGMQGSEHPCGTQVPHHSAGPRVLIPAQAAHGAHR